MKHVIHPKEKIIGPMMMKLATREDVPLVGPSRIWDPAISGSLTQIPLKDLFSSRVKNLPAAQGVVCGLLLLNDDLAGSLKMSQTITSPWGPYWQGLMHRREGDFSNAKYWFRAPGKLPVFKALAEEVRTFHAEVLDQEDWNPEKFTDHVERASDSCAHYAKLRHIQVLEMEYLLGACYRKTYEKSEP